LAVSRERLYAYINVLGLVTVIGLVVWDYFSGGVMYHLINEDTQGFKEFFNGKEVWIQMLLIVFIIIIEVIVGVIPGILVYSVIGILINPLLGSGLILLGNIIGSIANFYQGRILSTGFSDVPAKERKWIKKLDNKGAWSLFLLRLNPLTSFDFLPYFAGGAGMDFWKFFWANTIGLIPLILIGTYIGSEVFTKYSWALQLLGVLTVIWIIGTIVKSKINSNY